MNLTCQVMCAMESDVSFFEDSDCSDSATVEAESLGTKSELIGTVLGHAVVRSSWGKCGCER